MHQPLTPLRILLIEDNPGDARLIQLMLDEAGGPGFRLETVDRLSRGLERMAAAACDVVLLDLSLPDAQGLDTFLRAQAAAPELPIVVLSGLDDEALAVRAVQEGAQDYLVKGHVDGGLLLRAMRYAIERKRLEQARREVERQKDEFLANISHDLRTPLTGIKASIGVVLANEPPGTPEPLHRLFVNIDQAADRMARLVDDLLELARLQAGRVRLQLAEVDLRELAARAARAIEPLALARGQRVELELPAAPVLARVDAERVERAVLNLLSNAHKYGRDGGYIRVSLALADGQAHLAVADDGPGIAEAELAHIFERFYRTSEAHGRTNQGSGLGLSIARAMVELHGGRIWAESVPGQGATFHIALPVVEAADRCGREDGGTRPDGDAARGAAVVGGHGDAMRADEGDAPSSRRRVSGSPRRGLAVGGRRTGGRR